MSAVVTAELVETRLGQPRVIGRDRHGKDVWSSIDRRPAWRAQLYLTPTGLQGDLPTETQAKSAADPGRGQMHGGHDKAVYAYPTEHYPAWEAELGKDGLSGRSLGENWRVKGLAEAEVHIGDIWELGVARLEVSKVRTPCQTLVTYFDGQPMIKRMAANGLCGWYLRVLRPGPVPTNGTINVVYQNLGGPTVAQVFAAKMRPTRT